jgi:solute carrier family 35, member E1
MTQQRLWQTALTMASIANVFAAIKGAENSKLMKTKGLKDRIGGVGNQFALTEVSVRVAYK